MTLKVLEWDTRVEAWFIKEGEDYFVHVIPMIYNDRIVLTPKKPDGDPEPGYDYGWCYAKVRDGSLAVAYALAWTPETEAEPVGWIKQICSLEGPRTIGESSESSVSA